jgi:hypothetical protein
MKLLVNIIQVLIIAAIVYPLFLLWDKNNVEHFCHEVKAGITKQALIYKTDHAPIKFTKPTDKDDKGYWSAKVVTYSPFSDYHCKIRGLGDTVASAWIEE